MVTGELPEKLTRFLDCLEDVTEEGENYRAVCPAHGGHSLLIRYYADSERIVPVCKGGCEWSELAPALREAGCSLTGDNETYTYRDAFSVPLFQQVRWRKAGDNQTRQFWRCIAPNGVPLRHSDKVEGRKTPACRYKCRFGRKLPPTLYRLPELRDAIANNEAIYLCEGPKDAEAIRGEGACATSTMNGADDWNDTYLFQLEGASMVNVISDHDQAGYRGAYKKASSIASEGIAVRILLPALGKDAFDHVANGKSLDEFTVISLDELGRLRKLKDSSQASTVKHETALGGEYALLNDTGNAYLLRELHGDDLLFIPELDDWFVYAAGVWFADPVQVREYALDVSRRRLMDAEEADEKLAPMLRKFAVACGSQHALTSMLVCASVLQGMRRSIHEFDPTARMAVMNNCTLILKSDGTVDELPHSPDHLATVRWQCDYDPDCASSLLDSYEEIFLPDPGERDFAWRRKAYSLFERGNPEKKLFIELGPTNSGKTTINELLYRALGEQVLGPMSLSILREHRSGATNPELVAAMRKRMVFSSEAGSWVLNGDTIKRATGQDTLTATLKYSNSVFTAIPNFTPHVASNDMPSVRGADPATQARIIVQEFEAQIDESEAKKTFVRDFPTAEFPAVLNRLLAGWASYCQVGLAMPEHAMYITQQIRAELSPYDMFLSAYELDALHAKQYEKDQDASWRIAAGTLYVAFDAWWIEQGMRASERPSQPKFGQALKRRGLARGIAYDSETKKAARVWYGIRKRIR
jgi:D5 N terminal like